MLEDPSLIRFIVMPIVGTCLGIRDGSLDAKAGVAPFQYTVAEFIKATAVPFTVMTVINILAQASAGGGVSILEAFGMGGLCAGILYTVGRNISNEYNSRQKLEETNN
jgi:hypothetical protein